MINATKVKTLMSRMARAWFKLWQDFSKPVQESSPSLARPEQLATPDRHPLGTSKTVRDSGGPSMAIREKVVIFVDVANSLDVDFSKLLAEVRADGNIEKAQLFGDFRQQHLTPLALEYYASGDVDLIHCPSWPNGNGSLKRSDDTILIKAVAKLLCLDPSISMYVICTADADVIPIAQLAREQGKRVVFYSDTEALGWLIQRCTFEMRPLPLRNNIRVSREDDPSPADGADSSRRQQQDRASLPPVTLSPGELLKEIQALEKAERFLTFGKILYRVAKIRNADERSLRQTLSNLTKKGAIQSYEYPMPALRLQRSHPEVIQALKEAPPLAATA